MFIEPRLAWRNVWRNRRRTGLTVAATVFAVVLVVFFVAMAAGLHEKMIEDSVRVASGHVALSAPGYLEKGGLEHFIVLDEKLETVLAETPGIRGVAPRIVSFGLLSKKVSTKGVLVLGVDPEREASVTTLSKRLEEGRFVSADTPYGIVLGGRLAHSLDAQIGDELLLYSIAYSLETAYALFRVTGIMHLPEAELDRSISVIRLADAQEFFVYGDRVSEVAILVEDADHAPSVQAALARRLDNGQSIEVHLWNEIIPELEQFILLDDAGMYIMLVILVVVVAFGILNTILMAVLERKQEFGVMLALGLRPIAVFRLVYLESLMLAAVGLVLGLVIGIVLVLWFQAHPIPLVGKEMQAMIEMFGFEPVLTWKLKPLNLIGSTLTILGVAILAALYPSIKASRGRPVDVLRSL